jgi:RES domain
MGDLHQHRPALIIDKNASDELVAEVARIVESKFSDRLASMERQEHDFRARYEAEQARMQFLLEKATGKMESIHRLLGEDKFPQTSYLPTDLDQLTSWKKSIEMHLSTAGLYTTSFSIEKIMKLPRIRFDGVWYRLARFVDPGSLYAPEHLRTRYNPGDISEGGFRTLAMAEDVSTATFEISAYRGPAEAVSALQQLSMMQIHVSLDDLVDLSDPEVLSATIGIGAGALRTLTDPGIESVTQRLCRIFVQLGFPGAIIPSVKSIGKRNLVVFPKNLRSPKSIHVNSVSSPQAG